MGLKTSFHAKSRVRRRQDVRQWWNLPVAGNFAPCALDSKKDWCCDLPHEPEWSYGNSMVYKRKSKRYWKLWNSVNDSHVYISYYIYIWYIYIWYIYHIFIYIYTHRIHGAGIYANIKGVYSWDPCYHIYPYIAAPWILWDIYIYTIIYDIYMRIHIDIPNYISYLWWYLYIIYTIILHNT